MLSAIHEIYCTMLKLLMSGKGLEVVVS